MKRLAIFAHYDAEDEVKSYVTFLLSKLRAECEKISFVSTARLPAGELAKVAPHCAEMRLEENVGLDFGMWRHALERIDVAEWDEIVLLNSSFFGPLRPLGPIFERMGRVDCDFWGMTDSDEYAPHVQSYFLVFRRSATSAPCFSTFWQSVLPYRDKSRIIQSYEIGLTTFLVENGLRRAVVAPLASLPLPLWQRLNRRATKNPTSWCPLAVLAAGMPFVKLEVLRDNPAGVPLTPIYRAMEEAGYDLDLVQFDRPVTQRWSLGVLLADRAAILGRSRASRRR